MPLTRQASIALYLAVACGLTLVGAAAKMLAPEEGLRRSFYTQAGFAGTPIEDRTSEIDLRFLDDRPDLPRRFFSVRWRGFLFLRQDQSVEIFAGGNDEVNVRVDGQLVLRRNLSDGFRTTSRTLALDAGAHEIIVEYQQFGGGMSLNIQRAISGGRPRPFLPEELFAERVNEWRLALSRAAEWLARMLPIVWIGLAVLIAVAAVPRVMARWPATGAPHDAREYARRVWLFAGSAALGPAVVFVLGPHTIVATNRSEFAVSFSELALPWLLRTAAIHWMGLLAVGCVFAFMSERLTRVYAALLLAFGLLLWGQGNVWNPSYGVLTGREIDFAEHAWRAPYELAGWGTGLLLAMIFFRPVGRVASFAALAFLVVQLGAAGFDSARPVHDEGARWVEPPTEIFQFSRKQNVIHIVLDEFQSDLFSEILEEDRATLDRQFSGFEYFADHAGAFPTTSFSMPAMLTGQEYRNQKPAPEFVREAFKQSSIFEKLSGAGYDIDVVSIVPLESLEQWLGTEAAPNWNGARFRIRKPFVSRDDYRKASAQELVELSLFRHVPHTIKAVLTDRPEVFYRALWIDRQESLADVRRHHAANAVAFLDHFTGAMTVARERPVYKLLHVGVPHRPIVVDRECRFLGVTKMSRESYLEQSRCALRVVAALLDRARALGIYDSSVIIVSSDHGTDLQPFPFTGRSASLSLLAGPSTVRLPAIVGTAKALMLVKPAGRSGPIAVSEAPTSHLDFPPTVLDLLGLDGGSRDASMFRRDPKQPRTRSFGMYHPSFRFPTGYLERIDVLSIDGRVLDAAAWNVQSTVWPPDLKLESGDIDVGPRTANRHLGPGWSFELREPTDGITFVRPVTKRAVLYASLPSAATDVVLRASSPNTGSTYSISAEVDGRPAPFADPGGGDGYREMSIRVPADPARPSISQITLQFDTGDDPIPFKLDRITIR